MPRSVPHRASSRRSRPAGDLPRMDVAALRRLRRGRAVRRPRLRGVDPAASRPCSAGRVALPGATGPARGRRRRAFFAQGGRRVWVVRCGDAATAAARFPLPGVIAVLRGDAAPRTTGCAPRRSRPAAPGRSPTTSAIAIAVRRERIVVEPSPTPPASGSRPPTATSRPAVSWSCRCCATAWRRAGSPCSGGRTRHDVFAWRSALTVTRAPALAGELAGHVGELAARMARDARRPRADHDRARARRAAPTAIGRLVRFDPDARAPAAAGARAAAPEPPTWVLVDDVSAPPAGAGAAAVVVSGRAVNVDRDPSGELQAGVGAALALELSGRALADGTAWRLSGVGCTPGRPAGRRAARRRAALRRGATGSSSPRPSRSAAPASRTWPRSCRSCRRRPASRPRRSAPATRRRATASPGTVRHALLGRRDDLAGTSVAGLASLVAARDRAIQPGRRCPGSWRCSTRRGHAARRPGRRRRRPAGRRARPRPRSRAAARARADAAAAGFGDLRRAAGDAGARRRRAAHRRRDAVVGRARRDRVRGRALHRRRRDGARATCTADRPR